MSAESYYQKQKEKMALIDSIRSKQVDWISRFGSIKDTNQAAFCEKHGINKFWFNRLIHMKQLASENVFKKVENAFKSEGV